MNYKILSVILAVAVIGMGAYGYYYVNKPTQIKVEDQTPVKNYTKENVKDEKAEIKETGDISKDYIASKYRVLGVFQKSKNPDSVDDYKIVDKVQLVVAAERSKGDSNDSQCGSLYTQPTCYFFIEPLYIIDAPASKYLGQLKSQGAFDPKSVVFKSPNIVEFDTADGDGPGGYLIHWALNLETGNFKQLSRKDFGPNE